MDPTPPVSFAARMTGRRRPVTMPPPGRGKVVNIRSGEPWDVYIGRAGHGHDGRFGNPIRLGELCMVCGGVHTREERRPSPRHLPPALRCYRKWLDRELQRDRWFRDEVRALAGRRLGCFCAPGPCHGDVLARAALYLDRAGDGPHRYR